MAMMKSYTVCRKALARLIIPAGMVALLLCLSVPRAIAEPQEQWLGYRHSSDSARIVGKTPGQALELSADKPTGLDVPEFNNPAPLFAKWKSPLAPNGFLWLAFDSSGKTDQYDQLYIDTDADGSLADETPVRAGKPEGLRENSVRRFSRREGKTHRR